MILYSGYVQGVGFRYTTASAARGFEVTGTVRNLPDGRVELIAEGDRAELDRFQREISQRMHGHIEHVEIREQTADGSFHAFTIAR